MDADLVRQTYHIIKRTFLQYNKYSQQTLAELLLAMFSHQRFTLRHIASRLLGQTNVKHKLKRLQNFLDKLTLDEQFWQSFVQTLFCLPVYLRQWKGVNTTYDYWKRVEEFVTQLKALLPGDLDYVLIGDGGFEGARMFALCRRVGWDQVIRINGNYAVRTPGGAGIYPAESV